MKLINVLLNALRPGYAGEMLHKIGLRLRERRLSDANQVAKWCRTQERSMSDWACALDSSLWNEALAFAAAQREFAEKKLASLGIDLGGGGAYDLLYFLTRLVQPQVVVETGVAAGFSSRAFLSALKRNGSGDLLSSDFPYFRLAHPESYVGILVEPELRGTWTPLILGDRKNLPEIIARTGHIDLFHYDSDKSYSGRQFAVAAITFRLTPDAIMIFDDIQDNWHFRDISENQPSLIFPFEGKWLGIVGGSLSLYQCKA